MMNHRLLSNRRRIFASIFLIVFSAFVQSASAAYSSSAGRRLGSPLEESDAISNDAGVLAPSSENGNRDLAAGDFKTTSCTSTLIKIRRSEICRRAFGANYHFVGFKKTCGSPHMAKFVCRHVPRPTPTPPGPKSNSAPAPTLAPKPAHHNPKFLYDKNAGKACRMSNGSKGVEPKDYVVDHLSLKDCMKKCDRFAGCSGIEYHNNSNKCEIWKSFVDDRKLEKVNGVDCYTKI